MGRQYTLNLASIPWPLNILKSSQMTRKLDDGEDLLITLTDPDVRDNLQLLFESLDGVAFTIKSKKDGYLFHICRTGEIKFKKSSDQEVIWG